MRHAIVQSHWLGIRQYIGGGKNSTLANSVFCRRRIEQTDIQVVYQEWEQNYILGSCAAVQRVTFEQSMRSTMRCQSWSKRAGSNSQDRSSEQEQREQGYRLEEQETGKS